METRRLGRMASHGKQTDEKRSRDVQVKKEVRIVTGLICDIQDISFSAIWT